MPKLRRPTNRDVFINCPFDEKYKEQFHALVFTIYDCGFYPRCALESSDSGQLRFQKICGLIRDCCYGIHDLSRIELDSSSQLPRFNMPLELGLFMGAKEFSKKKARVCLVMDSERYRYQRFCSDLAGIDIEVHGDEIRKLICVVRDWLRTNQQQEEMIPGGEYMFGRYKTFLATLPELCDRAHQDPKSVTFHELKSILEGWFEGNDWRGVPQAAL